MATNYSPRIVTDGLILCLDAADRKSYPGTGTTWTDRSGRGNNGTLGADIGFSSSNGGYFTFDGASDTDSGIRVAVTDFDTTEMTGITMSAWVKSNSISTSQNIISRNGPYFMRIVGSKLRMGIYTGSWLFADGPTTLSSDTWYNFAITWDETTAKSYINGVLEDTESKTGSLAAGTTNQWLGYTSSVGEQGPFDGQMAKIDIYDGALTASEVLQNFNAIKGRFGLT